MKIGIVLLVSLVLAGCASTPRAVVAPVSAAPAQLAIDCEGNPKRCYDQATLTCNGDWHVAGWGDFDGEQGHYRMYVRCGQ